MDKTSDAIAEDTKALLIAIGYVATSWARLEHAINRVIWSLAAMCDEDGACLTAQIPGILPRMRALVALCHRYGAGDALLKDLNKFASHVDGLARQRNRIVHDPWRVNEDSGQLGRLEITANNRLVFEVRPHTTAEVVKVANDINNAARDFGNLHERIKHDAYERFRKQIREHLDIETPDLQDLLNPSTAPEAHPPPPRSSQA